jgi:Putative DNA-binding domain
VDTGTADLDDFSRRLAACDKDAYVRALLKRTEPAWELYHAWALIGAEPPQWAETTWQYEHLAFVACRLPAHLLAGLCSPESGSIVNLGQFEATVPGVIGPSNWTRRPSYPLHERVPLSFPVTEYRIVAANQENRQIPHQMLVAEGTPSFPEPQSAWRAFSESDFSLSGASQPPNEFALLRIAEDEAWIGAVHVSPTSLTANVHGNAVRGAQMELYGIADRSAQRLDGPGIVTFPLSDGLPASAWLWLKRGSHWLDYRSIDARSGWTGDLSRAGVEIEQAMEPQANIEALIASGEGPQLEFKERLPTGSKDRKMLKTVAAFATWDGGTMIFGINRDELTITGLGDEDPTKLRDRLVDLVRAAVDPMPPVTVTHYKIDGKLILVLDIEAGQSPPYGLIADPGSRDKPDFYVRRGASTYHAQPSDLREATLRRSTPENHADPTPFGSW